MLETAVELFTRCFIDESHIQVMASVSRFTFLIVAAGARELHALRRFAAIKTEK